MARTYPVTFVLGFFLFLFAAGAAAAERAGPAQTYGEGWSEEISGYTVLHLKGTEREMGRQYGYLAGDLIQDNLDGLMQAAAAKKKWLRHVPSGIFRGLRRVLGRVFWHQMSGDVRDHLRGIVEGAAKRDRAVKLHKFDLAFVNALVDLVGILNARFGEDARPAARAILRELEIPALAINCDSLAVFGARTVDGKTFQSRNADVETGQGLEKHPLILIYKKTGKVPIVSATFAGMVGILSGMNAHGLALGQVWAFSWDARVDTPWQIRMREIFMEAGSAADAVELLKRKPRVTYGSNFVFADGQGGALVAEMSGRHMEVFESNDPAELDLKVDGQSVGLPLKDAVLRGDLSLSPKLRKRQTAARGPKGDPRVSQAYIQRYLGLYERVLAFEAEGTLIGHKEMESISRETAMRGENLQDVVYANTDRDLWVTVSQIQEDGSVLQAYERPYAYIPFSRYLTDVSADQRQGKVRIRSWLPENHPRASEKISLYRDNGDEWIETLTLGEVITKGSRDIPVSLAEGELLSLRAEDGTVLERVKVQ